MSVRDRVVGISEVQVITARAQEFPVSVCRRKLLGDSYFVRGLRWRSYDGAAVSRQYPVSCRREFVTVTMPLSGRILLGQRGCRLFNSGRCDERPRRLNEAAQRQRLIDGGRASTLRGQPPLLQRNTFLGRRVSRCGHRM